MVLNRVHQMVGLDPTRFHRISQVGLAVRFLTHRIYSIENGTESVLVEFEIYVLSRHSHFKIVIIQDLFLFHDLKPSDIKIQV